MSHRSCASACVDLLRFNDAAQFDQTARTQPIWRRRSTAQSSEQSDLGLLCTESRDGALATAQVAAGRVPPPAGSPASGLHCCRRARIWTPRGVLSRTSLGTAPSPHQHCDAAIANLRRGSRSSAVLHCCSRRPPAASVGPSRAGLCRGLLCFPESRCSRVLCHVVATAGSSDLGCWRCGCGSGDQVRAASACASGACVERSGCRQRPGYRRHPSTAAVAPKLQI